MKENSINECAFLIHNFRLGGHYDYSLRRGIALLFLDFVGGQHHALAALPPGKTRYPLYKEVG
jgi:hypothetical protein